MPPRKAFTTERAQTFGSIAVANATDSLGSALSNHHLACTYKGVSNSVGGIDSAGAITGSAILVYEWHIAAAGIEEAAETRVRCNNAASQGIPFPQSWKTALDVLSLTFPINLSTENVPHECGATNLECKLLGPVKAIPLADPGATQPGAIVTLPINGARVPYFLCAWVRGSFWLCHRGTFDSDDLLDASNPFDERNLVIS